MRRDGQALELIGFDTPIRVGRRATLYVKLISDDPDYLHTTRTTTTVVRIRRLIDSGETAVER